MRAAPLTAFIFVISLALTSCARKTTTFSQKDISKTFGPLLKFMDVKPGTVLADVGAGSGALTVAMSSLMDSSAIYIQDIDTTALRQKKLQSLISQYSRSLHTDLLKRNTYRLTIGDAQHTYLPDNTFDVIYTNATAHVFTSPDSIFRDIGRKLKPGGVLYVRDCFKNLNGVGTVCSDLKCGKPLFSTAEFIAMMERNRFTLVKQAPSMSGYPVFGFSMSRD
jgi:predicted methyltransferase